ncbi:hypothetical protein LguiA_021939 [Lonicera macranthoides]
MDYQPNVEGTTTSFNLSDPSFPFNAEGTAILVSISEIYAIPACLPMSKVPPLLVSISEIYAIPACLPMSKVPPLLVSISEIYAIPACLPMPKVPPLLVSISEIYAIPACLPMPKVPPLLVSISEIYAIPACLPMSKVPPQLITIPKIPRCFFSATNLDLEGPSSSTLPNPEGPSPTPPDVEGLQSTQPNLITKDYFPRGPIHFDPAKVIASKSFALYLFFSANFPYFYSNPLSVV